MTLSQMKLFYFLFLFLSSMAHGVWADHSLVQLNANDNWSGANRQKLNALIRHFGIQNPHYNAQHKPVAAFDWDNTMMKNDIGEATLLWMIAHGLLKRPKSFRLMNPWLTSDALHELATHCGGSSAYLPTQLPACADTVLTIYHNQVLENGASAWKPSPDGERIFPPYFFYAQLFAGYSPAQIAEFTQQALTFNLTNKIGARQKIGTKYYPAYVRLYKPMIHLVAVLKQNGFDVWIISASLQSSVEVVASHAGIARDHVIGIRQMINSQGQLTDTFQGCGSYPDGNKDIISNRLGKRCWLNKVVFKLKERQQLSSPAAIVFAAGDSAGDLVFLKDAQGGRLVINKNNAELLCQVFRNSDGTWLLNPMFIEPVANDINNICKRDAQLFTE
jgi:phosphoserine phosphatase